MKTAKTFFLAVIAVVFLFSSTTFAEGEFWNLTKKATSFLAGVGTGYVIHEAGHHVMANELGEDISWSQQNKGICWWVEDSSSSNLRKIALAGFGADVLGSNIIMGTKRIPKDNSYVLGILAFELINPLLYIASHELGSEQKYDDLRCYEENGGDALPIKIGLVLNSAFNFYRLYHDPGFKVMVKTTRNEFSAVLRWEF